MLNTKFVSGSVYYIAKRGSLEHVVAHQRC